MSEAPMLPSFFGEDEHTAAEGAYSRMLKARKWLYLAAAAGVLHSYRLLDFEAFKKLLGGTISIPPWMATLAITVGLFYLIVQYSLLIVQLIGSYRAIIRARLPETQEMMQLRQAILGAKQQIQGLNRSAAEAENRGEIWPPERVQDSDHEVARLTKNEALMRSQLEAALAAEPTKQSWFLISEYAIDGLRIAAPLIAAMGGLIHLGTTRPGF